MRHTALSLVLTCCLLIFAGEATAQTASDTTPAPAAAPPTQVAAAPGPDELICKVTPIIGSRLPSRLCLTKRRWDQMHRDGVDFIRRVQDSATSQSGM